MLRKIILNGRSIEKCAAILENNKLVEFLVESTDQSSIVGNIYKGRVEKVVPGMQAAFVNIGLERNGFLTIDQLPKYKSLTPDEQEKTSISHLLHEGEEVIVQVTKDAFGEKGPRLTMLVGLPGTFVVYLPNESQITVSKKLSEKEKEHWRSFGREICKEAEGVIFRTACARQKTETIQKEFLFLKNRWFELKKLQAAMKRPALLFDHAGLVERLLRDYIGTMPTEIIMNDGSIFRWMKERLSIYEEFVQISLFMNKEDIFSYFHIDQELEGALKRQVDLENGSSIVIDETEAMTVIDVNSGKFTDTKNLRDMVLKTNEMAAVEIARQLRLRNIGGIILIDFINMSHDKDREFIKNKLQTALEADMNFTKVYGFTQLGLLEMTRKKERKTLREMLMTPCPICHEVGRIVSSEQLAFRLERALWEFKGSDYEAVWVEAPQKVVEFIQADNYINVLEEKLGLQIFLTSTERLIDQFNIRHVGSVVEIKERLER